MKKIKAILIGIAALLGMTINAQELLPYPLDTIDGKIYYRYTVPRGIGIYRIGVNFGVSQEDILQANPHILTKGIRYDEVILVPAKLTIEEQSSQVEMVEETPSTTVVEAIPQEKSTQQNQATEQVRKTIKRTKKGGKNRHKLNLDSTIIGDSIVDPTKIKDNASNTIRLAIMLPLQTDALKRDKNMDRFFDFYSGSLLAINEVQQEGQSIEVFTYDVGKNAETVTLLLEDSLWQDVDAIIGPAYPQQVSVATQYAQRDSTWILIPFLPNVAEVNSNPYVLKFNPSTKIAAEVMAEYLEQKRDSINCVVLESKGTENIPTSIAQLHKALKEHHIPTTIATLRQIYTDSIDDVFVEGKENIVIFNTENFNNIHALMPNLTQAAIRYNITLYSQYSWIDKNIVLPQIYTSAFGDAPIATEYYNQAFEQYFGHKLSSIHPRYDLLGYDLTKHLLHMLQQTQDKTTLPLETVWVGTQTNISYKKVSLNGGYENQTIHIIRK